MIIHLRPAVADGLLRPTRKPRASSAQAVSAAGGPAFLVLLRVGFTELRRSPGALVVSYTAVSPLPGLPGRAVCFLWHCPAGHPGWALPTTLPCGVRTFLSPVTRAAIIRPTRPSRKFSLQRRRATPSNKKCVGILGGLRVRPHRPESAVRTRIRSHSTHLSTSLSGALRYVSRSETVSASWHPLHRPRCSLAAPRPLCARIFS